MYSQNKTCKNCDRVALYVDRNIKSEMVRGIYSKL